MLRKLLATGVVFAAGYALGVLFGFRTAVVDYVENDANKLQNMADDLYPSPQDGAQELPDVVRETMEETENDGGSKGFQ